MTSSGNTEVDSQIREARRHSEYALDELNFGGAGGDEFLTHIGEMFNMVSEARNRCLLSLKGDKSVKCDNYIVDSLGEMAFPISTKIKELMNR